VHGEGGVHRLLSPVKARIEELDGLQHAVELRHVESRGLSLERGKKDDVALLGWAEKRL